MMNLSWTSFFIGFSGCLFIVFLLIIVGFFTRSIVISKKQCKEFSNSEQKKTPKIISRFKHYYLLREYVEYIDADVNLHHIFNVSLLEDVLNAIRAHKGFHLLSEVIKRPQPISLKKQHNFFEEVFCDFNRMNAEADIKLISWEHLLFAVVLFGYVYESSNHAVKKLAIAALISVKLLSVQELVKVMMVIRIGRIRHNIKESELVRLLEKQISNFPRIKIILDGKNIVNFWMDSGPSHEIAFASWRS